MDQPARRKLGEWSLLSNLDRKRQRDYVTPHGNIDEADPPPNPRVATTHDCQDNDIVSTGWQQYIETRPLACFGLSSRRCQLHRDDLLSHQLPYSSQAQAFRKLEASQASSLEWLSVHLASIREAVGVLPTLVHPRHALFACPLRVYDSFLTNINH